MDLLGDFYNQKGWVMNKSVVDLAEKYYVEPQTILQDRWRYKKKLNPIDK